MEQEKNTTKSRKGKHLTYEERIKIEALCKLGLTPTQIGEQVGGRSRRTIERELALGATKLLNSDLTFRRSYSADVAQYKRNANNTNKGPALKIGKDHKLAKHLEDRIKSGFSPYAALQDVKNSGLEFETSICVKTLYTYIENGLFLGITNKDLPVKKGGKKRNYHKIRQAITNVRGASIADRPPDVDARAEFGHWEMDTVVGKQGTKTALLVLSERMGRRELIFKLKSKSQSEVISVMNRLERKYGGKFKDIFKTITTDNGCEFLDFASIEKSLFSKRRRTKMYFAHPYSSWERGTNENINKMIRRFIPKGADIARFSNKDIQRIENWINNYPRKVLGGLSAIMVTEKYMAA